MEPNRTPADRDDVPNSDQAPMDSQAQDTPSDSEAATPAFGEPRPASTDEGNAETADSPAGLTDQAGDSSESNRREVNVETQSGETSDQTAEAHVHQPERNKEESIGQPVDTQPRAATDVAVPSRDSISVDESALEAGSAIGAEPSSHLSAGPSDEIALQSADELPPSSDLRTDASSSRPLELADTSDLDTSASDTAATSPGASTESGNLEESSQIDGAATAESSGDDEPEETELEAKSLDEQVASASDEPAAASDVESAASAFRSPSAPSHLMPAPMPMAGEPSIERPIVLISLTDGQTRQIINDALSAAGARDAAALEKIAESKVEHAAWVRACHERVLYW
jgi:hypothetical protein